jgi:hypothetical protein
MLSWSWRSIKTVIAASSWFPYLLNRVNIGTQQNQKNMKEVVKLHIVCISYNHDRHPVPKTFTPLHYTCRHFTSSHLNFTQLHFTALSFGLTPFKFPTAPFHLTSLHFTSLHFIALLDHFYLFLFFCKFFNAGKRWNVKYPVYLILHGLFGLILQ